jgi:hypothetical protein
MEKLSVADAVETHALMDVPATKEQTHFKSGRTRSGSDVAAHRRGVETVFVKGRTRTYSENLQVPHEFKSTRRRSSDVVDCIGDKPGKVHDMETTTIEADGATGGSERPTTLDMKPTGDVKWNQKQEAWKTTDRSSKVEIDATPCTPPGSTYNKSSDSR